MKKLLFGMVLFGAFAITNSSLADDRGSEKRYYGEVECPDGSIIPVTGKCCEPGGVFMCNYVSCSNYTPLTLTCPSIGG